jgi:hypothetical protein
MPGLKHVLAMCGKLDGEYMYRRSGALPTTPSPNIILVIILGRIFSGVAAKSSAQID